VRASCAAQSGYEALLVSTTWVSVERGIIECGRGDYL
jgi:hypothetical protein